MDRRFNYIERKDGIVLLGCYGTTGEVKLPERLRGKRILSLEAYAFSSSEPEERPEMQSLEEAHSAFAGELIPQRGREVTKIWIPSGVERIGNYCFYGCGCLEEMTFTDRLRDIGGGAFTGCRLKRLEIDFLEGEKSCLKDVTAENRYELQVTLRYHAGDGSVQTAKVLFPEHYEEAVENTPARIVMTHYHGSGGNYRQCFYQKKLDYKEYDELFPHAVAWEETGVLLRLVFGRLLYPYRLSVQAKERYQDYLREHAEAAAELWILQEDIRGLRYLTEEALLDRQAMEAAIAFASERGRIELLSYLMEAKNRLFPAGKRVFVW